MPKELTNRELLEGLAGVSTLATAIFGLAAWYLEVLEEEQRRE